MAFSADRMESRRAAGDGSLVVTLRSLADFKAKAISWLWPGKIPLGKLTLVAGPGGQGKSQFICFLAAAVTDDAILPGGARAPQGTVLYLSAEDDVEDTIKPRMLAAGADPHCVKVLGDIRLKGEEQAFDLESGFAYFQEAVRLMPDLRLVAIDPVTAYMGKAEAHKAADVRRVLKRYADLAAERAIAVVLVTHLNRGTSTNAAERTTASIAFVHVARASFLIAPDPNDEDRRVFTCFKNNLSPDTSAFAFRIVPERIANPDANEPNDPGELETSRIEWEPDAFDMHASELLVKNEPVSGRRNEDAMAFILTQIEDGPIESNALLEAARAHGIAVGTLKLARRKLKERGAMRAYLQGGEWWVRALHPDRAQRN